MNINFKENIILENSSVRLEPLAPKHWELLTPIVINNPKILQYSPPKFGTKELLKKYIDANIEKRNHGLKYPFVIYDKLKEAYAGSTSYLNISAKDERLEIGSTWIGKKFQRTGLNRNCKFLLLKYAFEKLKYQRVELKTDSRNIQSQTAIQAIGAKYEGTLRSHTLMSDGYRRDTIYYSILIDEWQGIKETVFKAQL